jgi:hypothetical protein
VCPSLAWSQDILDAIKAYPPEQQTMAYNIIQEMEEEVREGGSEGTTWGQ